LLGHLEAKKWFMFPRSALEKHETGLVDDSTNAKVLAHPTSPSVHGWLPQSSGEAGGGTSGDRASCCALTEEVAPPPVPMMLG
jgi:hypothetical protein